VNKGSACLVLVLFLSISWSGIKILLKDIAFFDGASLMNIIEKTDEEILELAHPMWADLVKYSNEGNYGAFTRNFSSSFIKGANEIEMGKQFARSDLAKNLSEDYSYLGMIRRGEYVTVLYKVINKKDNGEWLGRLVLGYEKDRVRIFGATLF
jgi:hypothetical protein